MSYGCLGFQEGTGWKLEVVDSKELGQLKMKFGQSSCQHADKNRAIEQFTP